MATASTASEFLQLAVDVINPRDIGKGEADERPDNPDYPWHLLAEGDSWFTIAAIPSSNLLFELRLARFAQVLNLAYPGDRLKKMADLVENRDLVTHLSKRNFNSHFDALLLSGGGNDLIGAAPDLIRQQAANGEDPTLPTSYVDLPALTGLVEDVQAGFARIIELRDSATSQSRMSPAFIHTYDYATPRNSPARFLGKVAIGGPWLFRAFDGSGLDIALQQRISNFLIDSLAAALLELDSDSGISAKALPAFHVVDTRNTLVMANPTERGNSNDWLNEIHPNLGGYRKIAQRLSAKVNAVLIASGA